MGALMVLFSLGLLELGQPGPRPPAECKSAYGKTECGYGCVAAYGEVRCAKTPEGRCQAAYGEVTCWDPEDDGPRREPDRRHGRRDALPDGAKCESAYGQTACGFDCVAAYGEVKCAQSAMGVCASAYGKVLCWDPPSRVRRAFRERGPKAACETAYGKIGCGYGCTAAYGEIGCASAPGGVCEAAYGKVTCSE